MATATTKARSVASFTRSSRGQLRHRPRSRHTAPTPRSASPFSKPSRVMAAERRRRSTPFVVSGCLSRDASQEPASPAVRYVITSRWVSAAGGPLVAIYSRHDTRARHHRDRCARHGLRHERGRHATSRAIDSVRRRRWRQRWWWRRRQRQRRLAGDHYSSIMGTYGDCSVPCGGGVQARSVACIA